MLAMMVLTVLSVVGCVAPPLTQLYAARWLRVECVCYMAHPLKRLYAARWLRAVGNNCAEMVLEPKWIRNRIYVSGVGDSHICPAMMVVMMVMLLCFGLYLCSGVGDSRICPAMMVVMMVMLLFFRSSDGTALSSGYLSSLLRWRLQRHVCSLWKLYLSACGRGVVQLGAAQGGNRQRSEQ